MMKIAISSGGGSLDSPFEPRFGRVPCFVLYDTESGEVIHIDNTANMDREKGAGIKAAQAVADHGAEVLLTGKVGPKAMQVLEKKTIRLAEGKGQTVREALTGFGIDLSKAPSAGTGGRQGGTRGSGPGSSGKGRGMGGGGRGGGAGSGVQGKGAGARGRGPEKGGRGAGGGGRGKKSQ
ncbi:MAG: NifB/NifX family molybdenum-iron cluster-binding protein [Desulfohalobiaceae bacterium]